MITVSLGRAQRYAVVATKDYLKRHGRPRVPPDLLSHECIRVRLPDGALFRWRFEKDGEAIQIDVPDHLTLDEVNLSTDCRRRKHWYRLLHGAERYGRHKDKSLCPSAGLKAFLARAREMASAAAQDN